jgi:hypothetical protein
MHREGNFDASSTPRNAKRKWTPKPTDCARSSYEAEKSCVSMTGTTAVCGKTIAGVINWEILLREREQQPENFRRRLCSYPGYMRAKNYMKHINALQVTHPAVF